MSVLNKDAKLLQETTLLLWEAPTRGHTTLGKDPSLDCVPVPSP